MGDEGNIIEDSKEEGEGGKVDEERGNNGE